MTVHNAHVIIDDLTRLVRIGDHTRTGKEWAELSASLAEGTRDVRAAARAAGIVGAESMPIEGAADALRELAQSYREDYEEIRRVFHTACEKLRALEPYAEEMRKALDDSHASESMCHLALDGQSKRMKALREAAEGASLAWRNWLAGCAHETRWKEVEAAHIRLRDALNSPEIRKCGACDDTGVVEGGNDDSEAHPCPKCCGHQVGKGVEQLRLAAASLCDVIENPNYYAACAPANLAKRLRRALAECPAIGTHEGAMAEMVAKVGDMMRADLPTPRCDTAFFNAAAVEPEGDGIAICGPLQQVVELTFARQLERELATRHAIDSQASDEGRQP